VRGYPNVARHLTRERAKSAVSLSTRTMVRLPLERNAKTETRAHGNDCRRLDGCCNPLRPGGSPTLGQACYVIGLRCNQTPLVSYSVTKGGGPRGKLHASSRRRGVKAITAWRASSPWPGIHSSPGRRTHVVRTSPRNRRRSLDLRSSSRRPRQDRTRRDRHRVKADAGEQAAFIRTRECLAILLRSVISCFRPTSAC
jgi:hypothetical protein